MKQKNKLKIKKSNWIYEDEQGVTLIEAVVAIGLISLIIFSLYFALFNVTKLFADSKQKAIAVALANEKMEIVRNLEYDQIGVQGFIPAGPLLQTENISQNGFVYKVDTSVKYVDDAFDGSGAADPIETDYKQVKVKVSWTANGQNKSLDFFSKFVPEGLETNVGGGVLSINVVDGTALAVPSVTVKVDSVNDTPEVHGSVISDIEGNVRLQAMPHQEYKITVSKDGYETAETFADPPASSFTPFLSNVTAIDGDVVMKTITIDKSGNLTIKAKNIADGVEIEGVDIDLLGGRLIGNTPDTYNLDRSDSTDSDGEIEYGDISPGSYSITNLASLETASLKYIGADSAIPIQLASEENKIVQLVFAQKNVDSLLITVKDANTSNPVLGADVRVYDGAGFDQTVTTGADGMVYFPSIEDPPVFMTAGDFSIEITASGYSTYTSTQTVGNLVEHEALMAP